MFTHKKKKFSSFTLNKNKQTLHKSRYIFFRSNKMTIQSQISTLLSELCDGIHEREQIMAVCLLSTIAGHNTFLFGPPGTAKSLISRRLSKAFEESKYFEYLMNRFSTPEEVFGPVSIKALKEDCYTRKIEGYLPTANFAFLDEIWKASPAILNNLLTVINEHIFKNGDELVKVPLKSLIAASNEIPLPNQGLEALYDRFVIRLLVPPIQQQEHFQQLLNNKPSSDTPHISHPISYETLDKWREQLNNVQISEDTFLIIQYIRKELKEKFEELGVYVSDRRWQRAAILLKASAFCNGRTETNHSDAILLKHCLWTTPENREVVENIVMEAIKSCGFQTGISLADLDSEKESLDKEIHKELYYSKDVYNTVTLQNGKEYFKVNYVFESRYSYYSERNKKGLFYIPVEKLKTKREFSPVDSDGNKINTVTGKFDGQGSCTLSYNDRDYNDCIFTPKVLYKKGDKNQEVNKRLINSLSQSITDIREKCTEVLQEIENKHKEYQKSLASPFVTQQDIDVAVAGILEQIEQLNLRIKDCERLEALCR